MMWFVCYKYHRYFVCLVRDAFPRLEALVPSIVHQRTVNILADDGPYYHSGIKQTFNKKQAYRRSTFLHAKLLNQKEYISFCFSLNSATTWEKNK